MKEAIDWTRFQRQVAEYTGMPAAGIQPETSLYNDINLDSLGFFSLGMYLIKNFGIQIPLSAVASIQTVGDLWNLINQPGGQT